MNKWIRRGLYLLLTLAITAAGIFAPRALLGHQEAALLGVAGSADGKALRPYLDVKSNATRIALLYDQVWNGTTSTREPLDTELSAGAAIELAKRYLDALTGAIRRNCGDAWNPGLSGHNGQVNASLLVATDSPTLSAWIVGLGDIMLGLDAVSGVPVMIFGMFGIDDTIWTETADNYDISTLAPNDALWTALTEFYGELDGELFSFPSSPQEVQIEDPWQMHWHGGNQNYPIQLNGTLSMSGIYSVTLSVWLSAV